MQKENGLQPARMATYLFNSRFIERDYFEEPICPGRIQNSWSEMSTDKSSRHIGWTCSGSENNLSNFAQGNHLSVDTHSSQTLELMWSTAAIKKKQRSSAFALAWSINSAKKQLCCGTEPSTYNVLRCVILVGDLDLDCLKGFNPGRGMKSHVQPTRSYMRRLPDLPWAGIVKRGWKRNAML